MNIEQLKEASTFIRHIDLKILSETEKTKLAETLVHLIKSIEITNNSFNNL